MARKNKRQQTLLVATCNRGAHVQDLASGYMSGKLLQKLEAVHFMLQHHTSEHFGFLKEHTHNRTIFYHTLSRLLFMEDTPSNFKSFVAPLQQVSHADTVVKLCVESACFAESKSHIGWH